MSSHSTVRIPNPPKVVVLCGLVVTAALAIAQHRVSVSGYTPDALHLEARSAALNSSLEAYTRDTTRHISGTVVDASGAAIGGAVCELIRGSDVERAAVSLGREEALPQSIVTTNQIGKFRFESPEYGRYVLRVSSPGHCTYVRRGIRLADGYGAGLVYAVLESCSHKSGALLDKVVIPGQECILVRQKWPDWEAAACIGDLSDLCQCQAGEVIVSLDSTSSNADEDSVSESPVETGSGSRSAAVLYRARPVGRYR